MKFPVRKKEMFSIALNFEPEMPNENSSLCTEFFFFFLLSSLRRIFSVLVKEFERKRIFDPLFIPSLAFDFSSHQDFREEILQDDVGVCIYRYIGR